jgi:ribosomal protein S7
MLIRALQDLHIPILLVPLRQGKQFNDVPVPVRRNKKDTISIQTLANAIVRRKELQFTER